MTKAIRIDAEADEEITHAIERYECEREGLGAEFWNELKVAMRTLEAPGPECGPVIGLPRELGIRRKLLPRFPYAIVFVATAGADSSPTSTAAPHRRQRADLAPNFGRHGEHGTSSPTSAAAASADTNLAELVLDLGHRGELLHPRAAPARRPRPLCRSPAPARRRGERRRPRPTSARC